GTINGATMTLGNATPVFAPDTSLDIDGDGYKDLKASFVDGNIGLTSSSTQVTVSGTANLPLGGAINFSGTDVVTMVASPVANVACSARGYRGNNGCWYKTPVNPSCTTYCGNHGGFNATASTHTGNPIGKGFFPLKANGGIWMSVECSSTDNNT